MLFIYKLSKLLLVVLVGLAFWILSLHTLFNVGQLVFNYFVLFPPAYINVSGTGSMYPTFPKGTSTKIEEKETEVVASPTMIRYPNGIRLNGKEYFKSPILKGDIVSFYSKDKALIKRVIGLPGDKIEIREGIVYINNEPQKEPYTALPHSTFGGEFIPECKELVIPEGHYFVLGDNRKESNDSRFDVGFVSEDSIDFLLPINRQKGVWDTNWRDASKDLEDSTKIKLSESDFIDNINSLRIEEGKTPFVLKAELSRSAYLRAQNIYKTGVFDEKSEDNLSISESIRQANYWKPIYGEIPVQGYFSAQELFNYLTEFENTRGFVLDNEFTEIGISVLEGSLNNCPTQLIVIHFAGYVPPNYDETTITSWLNLLTQLNEVLPGWKDAKNYDVYYDEHKRDIDKIISIMEDRISSLNPIVAKMKNNEWLSDSEMKYLEYDKQLGEQQENLANKLNDL
jgi:signal peptidase I